MTMAEIKITADIPKKSAIKEAYKSFELLNATFSTKSRYAAMYKGDIPINRKVNPLPIEAIACPAMRNIDLKKGSMLVKSSSWERLLLADCGLHCTVR